MLRAVRGFPAHRQVLCIGFASFAKCPGPQSTRFDCILPCRGSRNNPPEGHGWLTLVTVVSEYKVSCILCEGKSYPALSLRRDSFAEGHMRLDGTGDEICTYLASNLCCLSWNVGAVLVRTGN